MSIFQMNLFVRKASLSLWKILNFSSNLSVAKQKGMIYSSGYWKPLKTMKKRIFS